MKAGDRIRVNENCQFKYLRGAQGVIASSDGGAFDVVLDDPLLQGGERPWNLKRTSVELESPAAKPMLLTQDHAERKGTPITTGVLDYFPLALAYVARVSKAGNDQHNPSEALHWDKSKSKDHADCIARHLIDRGTLDPTDNLLHDGKLAWRALALLETALGNGTEP